MSAIGFLYPPSPSILHWLSAGQLAHRLQRTLRLWVLLHRLYGVQPHWSTSLPQPFSYPDIRERLFADSHGRSDSLSAQDLTATCADLTCLCHKTLQTWLYEVSPRLTASEWLTEMAQLTGLAATELEQHLDQCPFATVHRSLRDDLKLLSQQGWLEPLPQGRYRCVSTAKLPLPPPPAASLTAHSALFAPLSAAQTWEMLRVLEALAFVQPNLQLVVQALWEQLTAIDAHRLREEPSQRIFIHLDYILSEAMQEKVDDFQEQIEQLWGTPDGGVIQFKTWLAREERQVPVTVYPVCLHYARRAKYLSAYGLDPEGNLAWHNYRLDRIASKKLKVLAWGDPGVPQGLKELRHAGELPSPEAVKAKLDEAWGFNFYLPRQLLLLRFPAKFAHWYVDHTVRHPTFCPIAYSRLPDLIRQEITDPLEQQETLKLIARRSASDAYYAVWIRAGDINVMMRLRDWRPNGEVIAPLSLRQDIAKEVTQELAHYSD